MPNVAHATTTLTDAPLVSCIMPTRNRRAFVPSAVALFLRQSYPHRELVVLDDGEDAIADLLPNDTRIRCVRLNEVSPIGTKRNIACEHARGSIIAHWDDDDWYPSWRLQEQVAHFRDSAISVVGSRSSYFHDAAAGRAWRYEYGGADVFLVGSTLAYRRLFWQGSPFTNANVAEEIGFLERARSEQIRDLKNAALCVASVHIGNTSRRRIVGPYWREISLDELRRQMDEEAFETQ